MEPKVTGNFQNDKKKKHLSTYQIHGVDLKLDNLKAFNMHQ